MRVVRTEHDPDVEAYYIYVRETKPGTPVQTETEAYATVNVDYDEDGNVVGIEVLLPG